MDEIILTFTKAHLFVLEACSVMLHTLYILCGHLTDIWRVSLCEDPTTFYWLLHQWECHGRPK